MLKFLKSKKPYLSVSVMSVQGNTYTTNEDQFFIDSIGIRKKENEYTQKEMRLDKRRIFAVCDGMGGESHGDISAHLAVSILAETCKTLQNAPEEELPGIVNEYIMNVNKKICNLAIEKRCRHCGSTLAMVCMEQNCMNVFGLGDSRVYLFRNQEVSQILEDQTVANRKLKNNIYTEEEAKISADAHILTSFLGSDDRNIGLPVQFAKVKIHKGDVILICSDGLTDLLSKETIKKILNTNHHHFAKALLKAALQFDETDNVTCIVIKLL